ncbi:hypothetical protein G6514_008728 [Epicoccum nigrum]|nr:hypothetical protein G6514_008728 [Epicoccum nigrum]
MSLRSTILAAATFCAYAVDAHMIMASPVPFVKPDNGPINQAQWPCKKNLGFEVTTMNKMAVGEQQTLSFDGSAVHGGGSCQLSVTTDTEPTENSVWKVIQSIEGGCPGVEKAEEFKFELPDSIPNGKGTFAWTWFAKLSGGPEMYMNCAPIEVTGGASDTSKFDALPDMLVANLPGVTDCKQVPSTVLQIPNPGSVLTGSSINDAKPGTGCAAGSSPQPSGGAGTPASSAAGGSPSAAPSAGGNDGMYTPPAGAGATSAAATSAAAAPTSPAGGAASSAPAVSSAAATGGAGGVFAPGASSAAPAASTQTTLVTVTGTPSTPSKTTAAASKPAATTPAAGTGASGAAPTSAPAAGGSSGTCTTNGAVVCNGPTQFGLCNNGSVVWQAVAAGTTCSNGTIQKRGYRGRIVRRNGLVGHVHKH